MGLQAPYVGHWHICMSSQESFFHGSFAQGGNVSKIETLFGEAGIRVGKNREQLPSRANNVGSVSKCAQSGENHRDGHLTRLSVQQPKLYLVGAGGGLVVSFVIPMSLSRFMPKGILSSIAWPVPLGDIFL